MWAYNVHEKNQSLFALSQKKETMIFKNLSICVELCQT